MEQHLYPTKEVEMKQLTLCQKQYMSVAELFLWSEALDFTQWFTSTRKRWKRTEYTLPRLVQKKRLRAVQYGRKLVYTASQKASVEHIPHGLACTKALLRFKQSNDGVYISERFFRRHGHRAIPEWGIVHTNGTLLFEYTSADNFRRVKAMNRKLEMYRQELKSFQGMFHNPFYLFVVEAPKHEVVRFAEKLDESFYAIDAQTFFEVPLGEQLTTCAYIWGGDGRTYPLE